MREESDVQTDRPEPETPAKTELHLLPLIARHAPANGEGTGALLDPDMDHRAATGVHHVATDGRAGTHVQSRVGDVGNGQLRLERGVGRDDDGGDRVTRIVVHEMLDLRM